MRNYAVTAVGELFVKFQQTADNHYTTYLGGNSADVACLPAKYGMNTAFIGCVGADHFGTRLLSALKEYGVDISQVYVDPNHSTRLCFSHQSSAGSFTEFAKGAVGSPFSRGSLPLEQLQNTKVFHISGLSLIEETGRDETLRAISLARNSGALISFNADYTPSRWPDEQTARKNLLLGIKEADLAMVTQEELAFLGITPMELLHTYSSHFILISTGEQGCRYVGRDCEGYVQAAEPLKIVDTSDHADIFMGAFLYAYLQQPTSLKNLNQMELETIIRFANEKATLSTTLEGSLSSIPPL